MIKLGREHYAVGDIALVNEVIRLIWPLTCRFKRWANHIPTIVRTASVLRQHALGTYHSRTE